jgi:basic amino acid/polyamine antiporter, APA family
MAAPERYKQAEPHLRRALGIWAAMSIVIGTVIGSGIFRVSTEMVNAVGSPGRVFLVWIAGGILSFFGALTYAELSAAMPAAGGEYVYLNAAYGPFFGFIYGWTQTWVGKAASLAALATLFYTYLADFFPGLLAVAITLPVPLGPNWQPLEIRSGQILAIAFLLFLALGNYLGVRLGGGLQVTFTVLKVALIAGLIGTGLFSGQGTSANLHTSVPAAAGGVAGFFKALVAALWAYDGWNNAGMMGSEIERPERTLPRALILGTLGVMILYLLTNLAYFTVLSAPEVGASERVAADMMRRIVGARAEGIVSLAVLISIFAAANGSILSGSRIPFAMARDGLFFRSAAHVHPRFHTPSVGILLLGVWSSLLLLSGRYDELYTMAIFPSWILYGMSAAAVIVLRRRRPDLRRPYKVLGYPVIPVVFVMAAIALLYSTLMTSPRESGIGFSIILLGLPFYFHWKRTALHRDLSEAP